MRIAHLADLHIGRVFHGLSLIDDQRHILEQVVGRVRAAEADVLVLAGDLYDRALPGRDAVRLLDDFLQEVHRSLEIPVIAIAGNHDSGEHLGFGSWLFAQGDLHLRGRVDGPFRPVTVEDDHGEVTFYPIPYVEPETAAVLFASPGAEAPVQGGTLTHAETVEALLAPAHEHRVASGVRRSVVVAHGFVRGGASPLESPRSERALYLGGAGAVPASHFDGFSYVALGHLHRPQWVGDDRRVRYSGSLLRYAFEESDDPRTLSVVTLGSDGRCDLEEEALHPRRDLARIRGDLDTLLRDPALEEYTTRYVQAVVTDHPMPPQAMERLRERFPHLLEFRQTRMERDPLATVAAIPDERRGPAEVFEDFFRLHGPGAPTDDDRGVFREALAATGEPA